MEQPPTQPSETPRQQPSPIVRSSSAFKNILMGIFIGVLIGIAGLLFYQGYLPQITQALYTATWVIFGIVILTFIILFGLKEYLTRFIFGVKTASAKDVLEDAQRVSDMVTDRVADKLFADLPVEERGRIKVILPRLANWFVWGRLRNWWWQWTLGVFVSLGGLTGTMLLMNQNELLNNQNTLIERQMTLEEASRRSALITLMSNIMDKVDDEIKEQKNELLRNGISKETVELTKFSLSQSLIGQIAALSHSFKPYRFIEGDTLITKPLSPERGQLLITLILMPLDTSTFFKIYASSTFESSNLRKAILTGMNLSRANLSGSNLNEADLSESNLSGTILTKASLIRTDFSLADLRDAVLMDANLYDADLQSSDLTRAHLMGSKLKDTWLINANLTQVNLSGADISGADLTDADLSGAFLNGGYKKLRKGYLFWDTDSLGEEEEKILDVKGLTKQCNLSIRQASVVKSLYSTRGLPDSIKTTLLRTHPQLFEKSKKLF